MAKNIYRTVDGNAIRHGDTYYTVWDSGVHGPFTFTKGMNLSSGRLFKDKAKADSFVDGMFILNGILNGDKVDCRDCSDSMDCSYCTFVKQDKRVNLYYSPDIVYDTDAIIAKIQADAKAKINAINAYNKLKKNFVNS